MECFNFEYFMMSSYKFISQNMMDLLNPISFAILLSPFISLRFFNMLPWLYAIAITIHFWFSKVSVNLGWSYDMLIVCYDISLFIKVCFTYFFSIVFYWIYQFFFISPLLVFVCSWLLLLLSFIYNWRNTRFLLINILAYHH